MKGAMAQTWRNPKYRLTLFVTCEEEAAILKLFTVNGWAFIKVSDTPIPQVDTELKGENHLLSRPSDVAYVPLTADYPTEKNLTSLSSGTEQDTHDFNIEIHNSPSEGNCIFSTNSVNVRSYSKLPVNVYDVVDTVCSERRNEKIKGDNVDNHAFQSSNYTIKSFAGNERVENRRNSLAENILVSQKTSSSFLSSSRSNLNLDGGQLKEAAQVSKTDDSGGKLETNNKKNKSIRHNRVRHTSMKTRQNAKRKVSSKKKLDVKQGAQIQESHGEKLDSKEEYNGVCQMKNSIDEPGSRKHLYKEGDAVRNEVDKHIDVMSLMIVKNGEFVCCMCRTNYKSQELFKSHASQCLTDLLSTKGSNVYKCSGCRAFFRQAFTLLRHRRSEVCVPGQEKKVEHFLTCNTCGKTYPTRRTTEYIHHMQAHNNERPFVCEICGSDFVRWTSLRNHKRIHTGEKPYTCQYCPLTFISGAGKRNHEMVRHADLPREFVCDKCGASFKIRGRLTCHMKFVHDKTDIYSCDLCEKKFTRKGTLKDHKRTHVNIKDKTCDVCGKGFIRQSDLTEHIKRHRNERSFFCDQCDKGFYKKINLVEHKRSHSGVKPFYCDICKYQCAYYSNAVKHCRARHPEVQKLKDVIIRKSPSIV